MKTLSEPPAGASEGDRRRLYWLVDAPLATARDLSSLSGIGRSFWYDQLGDLRSRGLVDSAAPGWSRPLSMRWFMTGSGLSVVGMPGSTWHEEFARCRLLERLPSVEWSYRWPPRSGTWGPSSPSTGWITHGSIDAVVRYRYGWIALFWSGAFQSETAIANRLGRLALDLREMSVPPSPPGPACWPSWSATSGSGSWSTGRPGATAWRTRWPSGAPGTAPAPEPATPAPAGAGSASPFSTAAPGGGAGSSGWRPPPGRSAGGW